MTTLDTHAAERFIDDLLGVTVPPGWGESVQRYHELLAGANRETNLTRITEPGEFLVKHVVDSLLAVAAWPALAAGAHRCIDVGCGGGLPGIVLALTFPVMEVTLVDSSARKIAWVERFVQELGLRSARAIPGRARELARQEEHAGAYDVVTVRAVAGTAKLIRECRGLLAQDGVLLVYKTPQQIEEEEPLARREARKAELTLDRSRVLDLPAGAGKRQFWIATRG